MSRKVGRDFSESQGMALGSKRGVVAAARAYQTFMSVTRTIVSGDHRQWCLSVDGSAAPAASVFESQALLGFPDRLLDAPAIGGTLNDLLLRAGRVGAEEVVVLLSSGRIADNHQPDGLLAADVPPQADDALDLPLHLSSRVHNVLSVQRGLCFFHCGMQHRQRFR